MTTSMLPVAGGWMVTTTWVTEVATGELERGFDAVIVIGTTAAFPYIAAPVHQAVMQGKPTIEINPSESQISALVDVRLRLGAALAMDALWQALTRRSPA